MHKELLSTAAVACIFIAYLPYIYSILRGGTRPHIFSWLIWGIAMLAVFLAQREAGAGAGAWAIGVAGLINLLVACLAWLKNRRLQFNRADRWFLAAALTALPAWYLAADPLWAVVILTMVDLLGFGPTARKAWHHPHEEQLTFFTFFMVSNGLVILALESYSITTVLFPAAMIAACLALISMVKYRRMVLQ